MSTPGGPEMPSHGPYPPTAAGLGGVPNKSVDDPITSVFLVLFAILAVTHMTILQINLRQKKKFIMSGLIFGFCMARITSCTMRLVWSTHTTNLNIAIAAQIFMSAGVILLFLVNLIFVQRILRARHPSWAWSKVFSKVFTAYFVTIIIVLVLLIGFTVESFFTLSKNKRRIARDIQLFGATYFAVSAFMPIPLILLRHILPKERVEKFGSGRFRTKIAVLVFASLLLTLGAAFRAGIAYVPRPIQHPAWYHSKACFYLFNFTIEVIVVSLYAIIRVDKRFIVPDHSRRAGDYSGANQKAEQADNGEYVHRINTEEEVFDEEDSEHPLQSRGNEKGGQDVEAGAA